MISKEDLDTYFGSKNTDQLELFPRDDWFRNFITSLMAHEDQIRELAEASERVLAGDPGWANADWVKEVKRRKAAGQPPPTWDDLDTFVDSEVKGH